MRIAVINWTSRRVGGIENYLSAVIPELSRAGHDVAFFCEVDKPSERYRICLPDGSPLWCVAEVGAKKALAALGDWQPDVIYTHKMESPALEAKTMKIAPAVFFVHDYYGTCISGTKTHKFPVVQPCERRFGPKCLLHYFPNGCGGLSPLTMVKLYRLQSKRLELLHRYDAIVTHSDHMLRELINHGLTPKSAYSFPYFVGNGDYKSPPDPSDKHLHNDLATALPAEVQYNALNFPEQTVCRLTFSGRMELLKGGHVLLETLPAVQEALRKPLRVVFAGDGRKRKDWEQRAVRLQRQNSGIEVDFVGWIDRTSINKVLEESDLLIVPSLWPEPFGLVGPEAGLLGVPVAAFDVGGIRDWLVDGVNGYLAPGNPPTAEGLAQAIVSCVSSPEVHARLRQGAVRLAGQFNIKNHLDILIQIFNRVAAHELVGVMH